MTDKFKDEITSVVAKIIQIPEDKLKPDADFFTELGIDSMLALEIVAMIEKRFKIIIPEGEIPKVRSLNQVFELAEKLERIKNA